MNKEFWRIFFASIKHNIPNTLIYTLMDAAFVTSSIAFSMALAFYFGFDALHLSASSIGQTLKEMPILVLLCAAAFSGIALLARIGQAYMEASVTVSQEIAFAHKVRSSNIVEKRTAPRASNHYGRLAATSMRSVGAALILLMSLSTVPFLLKWPWSIAIGCLIVFAFVVLSFAFQFLSRKMKESSIALLLHARPVSIWKSDAKLAEGDFLKLYEGAYFWRIFINSIFSFAPLIFALLVVASLIYLNEAGVEVRFGAAFIAFGAAQAYLGLLSRLFTSATKCAAFISSIEPYSDLLFSVENPKYRQDVEGPYSTQDPDDYE